MLEHIRAVINIHQSVDTFDSRGEVFLLTFVEPVVFTSAAMPPFILVGLLIEVCLYICPMMNEVLLEFLLLGIMLLGDCIPGTTF